MVMFKGKGNRDVADVDTGRGGASGGAGTWAHLLPRGCTFGHSRRMLLLGKSHREPQELERPADASAAPSTSRLPSGRPPHMDLHLLPHSACPNCSHSRPGKLPVSLESLFSARFRYFTWETCGSGHIIPAVSGSE